MILRVLTVYLAVVTLGRALENGLVRTPPMGWLSWERFRCNTDCVNDAHNCISDSLIRAMADRIVGDGFADVGYEYVIIDDCWLSSERDTEGRLQPDPERFPYGIKDLAAYVHSKGLKFGIYEDYGTETCAGYPGILGHLEIDAQTFADWDVDYLKIDGCNSDPTEMPEGYIEFGLYLNQTERPIVYGCSWPFFQFLAGIDSNYSAVAEHCNLWRNYDDIEDNWNSVQDIMDHCAEYQDVFADHAGPGHWNDPDMLIIGNFGLNLAQSEVQMAIWSILAAPLLMSNDLRDILPEYAAILQNDKVIAINQDPLGIQGRRIDQVDNVNAWVRPVTPVVEDEYSYAIAFVNRGSEDPVSVARELNSLGLTSQSGYIISNIFSNEELGVYDSDSLLSVSVNPQGVVLLRADVHSSS